LQVLPECLLSENWHEAYFLCQTENVPQAITELVAVDSVSFSASGQVSAAYFANMSAVFNTLLIFARASQARG
jgi:hypothetical protein